MQTDRETNFFHMTLLTVEGITVVFDIQHTFGSSAFVSNLGIVIGAGSLTPCEWQTVIN